ncbi:cupin domain-containing protein [Agrobacterium tumefaciens]|uniref:cupin domain-containing protein n=1 Tax=Agrobacterium tumefaciens TaxID=358 RepID=UPI0012B9154F
MITEKVEEAKPVGFTTERLALADLASEIGSIDGHVLRMSRTTIAPDGGYAPHSHDGRPELIYVLDGIFTDSRDGTETNYGPGEVIAMTNGITHAIRNLSGKPVTYISVTVRKP